MEKDKVLVIVGPTASGKSDLAVQAAKEFDGEVISADSRQVYKGLDVGTGKITKKEMQGIPHHLIDVADPRKPFNASEYKALAARALRDIAARGKLPIIVGGTGFYIDAITCDVLFPDVPPNKKLREKLSEFSAEKLFSMLKTKDPNRAQNIDPKNKVRLVRALEIIDALGKVPPAQKKDSDYRFIYVGLRPEQEELNEKIYKRLITRLPGMLREAKKLHENGLSWKRMEELGLEYRYLARLLQNKIDKGGFVLELYAEIRKYSKRQMTWFKRNKEITWLKAGEPSALATIRALLG